MMPIEPIRDLMQRTLANLKFVEDRAHPDGPFEVTQLVNSFLGALAHPYESMKPELAKLSIADAYSRGWPVVRKERPDDVDPASLGDLVRLLRNSFAHGNIRFLNRDGSGIRSLRLWNENSQGKRTWGTELTVAEMRALLAAFARLIDDIYSTGHWHDRRVA